MRCSEIGLSGWSDTGFVTLQKSRHVPLLPTLTVGQIFKCEVLLDSSSFLECSRLAAFCVGTPDPKEGNVYSYKKYPF